MLYVASCLYVLMRHKTDEPFDCVNDGCSWQAY